MSISSPLSRSLGSLSLFNFHNCFFFTHNRQAPRLRRLLRRVPSWQQCLPAYQRKERERKRKSMRASTWENEMEEPRGGLTYNTSSLVCIRRRHRMSSRNAKTVGILFKILNLKTSRFWEIQKEAFHCQYLLRKFFCTFFGGWNENYYLRLMCVYL